MGGSLHFLDPRITCNEDAAMVRVPVRAAGGGEPAALSAWHRVATGVRVAVAAGVGLVAGLSAGFAGPNRSAILIGWDVAAVVFLAWTWLSIWPRTPKQTRELATREDPTRGVFDLLLVASAVVSLGAVGAALFGAGRLHGVAEIVRVSLGVVSVALSWAVVHSVYCLRYASLFYGHGAGIEFPEPDRTSGPPAGPDYADFAYLAFTIGMTYQVSDTPFTGPRMRRVALRHALVSFLFGTVILASTINLVAGLSSSA
jgi:uncharacterized membrane protein